MNEAYGYWFAGLCDGEASFNIGRCGRGGRSFRCHAAIALRRDDEDLLREVERVVGGRVYLTANEREGGDKPQAMWTMNTKADCARLCAVLDRYPLRSRKAKDYAIWREAVVLWQDVPGRWEQAREGAYDWTPFSVLQRQLREARMFDERLRGSQPGKV